VEEEEEEEDEELPELRLKMVKKITQSLRGHY
jgi:hypothetical protein